VNQSKSIMYTCWFCFPAVPDGKPDPTNVEVRVVGFYPDGARDPAKGTCA
jgi:hypothetical protein